MKATGWVRLWKLAQLIIIAIALFWAARKIAQQWDALRASLSSMSVHWLWIVLASAIVLFTYGMLIQSWRLLLADWGSPLRFSAAMRIWTIANLGRYVPGKVWSVGALGVLAGREGVSGVSAAGAAILGTLLNIGAGFGLIAISSARVLGVFKPWLRDAALAVSVVFVIGTLCLPRLLPPILERLARWRGLPMPERHLSARVLWISTAMNVASWALYGIAFAAFARGVAPQVIASPPLFIVIWTASYLSGYLVLLVPGGIGVREVVMASALVALGLAGSADATVLALSSRLWLTVWEILPGVTALLLSPGAARDLTRRRS